MWPDSQFPADLVTRSEEILNGNIFCAVLSTKYWCNKIWHQQLTWQKHPIKLYVPEVNESHWVRVL